MHKIIHVAGEPEEPSHSVTQPSVQQCLKVVQKQQEAANLKGGIFLAMVLGNIL